MWSQTWEALSILMLDLSCHCRFKPWKVWLFFQIWACLILSDLLSHQCQVWSISCCRQTWIPLKGELDDAKFDVLGPFLVQYQSGFKHVCLLVWLWAMCLAPTLDIGWLALMSDFPRLQNNPQSNLDYFHCNDVLLGRLSFWCQTEAPVHFDVRLSMPV